MPRKDESADLTRIAIVNKDKCKPKKCKQVIHRLWYVYTPRRTNS